ncbi:MAG TPA: hypothetical protein VNU92_09330 [Edaphobacter sp.]|jgi:hypothetical protein|nr:hypothetical protein [Edaphobacter sp.]
MTSMIRQVIVGLLLSLSAFVPAQTTPPPQVTEPDTTDLAKQTQNPVGDIVSVPFQFNFNGGGAYKDQTFFNLNFQPVIPIHLNPKWTFIARTIVPVVSIPTTNGVSYSGVGDIQEQTFLTPARPGKLIWGVGPAFSFPTATASPAKTGTWAAGPSVVLLATPGPFVLGSLFVQFSPMTDANGSPRVNNFLWQYFVNFNFGKGWALSTAPSITANWDADRSQRWTVPVGGGISRTLVFERQPMTLGFQYYYNPIRPDNSNSTTLRFNIALIYPQKRGK